MLNLVIELLVIVKTPFGFFQKSGITEPLEPITFHI